MSDRDKFAELKSGDRLWAVASIHGEAERLGRLHAELARRLGPNDRLVYLGNYVGHGGAAAETIDELLRFRLWFLARPLVFVSDLAYLRGAQEEMWHKLLQLQFATDPRGVLAWMLDHGVGATLAAYGTTADQGRIAARDGALTIGRWTSRIRDAVRARPGHDPFFSGLRRAATAGRVLFCHAGIDPSRPLNAQIDSFWWGSLAFAQMDQAYGDFARVVRGYDRQHPGLVETPFTVTLDGGAGFGGTLIACALDPDGRIVDQFEV
jgi:serine/threonine protein phosphatase 1